MTKATRRRHVSRRLGAALFICLTWCTPGAWSGATAASAPEVPLSPVLTLHEAALLLRISPEDVEILARHGEIPARRVGAGWRFNRAALLSWLNGDWNFIVTATPRRAAPASSGGETSSSRGDASKELIGEAPKERTAENVFLRGQKVLLGSGDMALELGQFYSDSDSQQFASISGGTVLAAVEQETFTTLLLGRVGVLDETEVFASTTFVDQDNGVFSGSQKIAESGRTEFGDVRLGVRRTLLKEGPGYPGVIATVDGRIPTGDTSWAAGGGLALVKSVDPVVLFANGNYRHTFSRDFADVTRLEPEEQFDVSLGYALALNDTLTLSSSVSGLFTGTTRFDNAELRRQNRFSLSFGLTSWLAEGLYIEPSVSFGLGDPGDSYVLGVTLPYTF